MIAVALLYLLRESCCPSSSYLASPLSSSLVAATPMETDGWRYSLYPNQKLKSENTKNHELNTNSRLLINLYYLKRHLHINLKRGLIDQFEVILIVSPFHAIIACSMDLKR